MSQVRKELGKISSVKFGLDERTFSRLGLTLSFEGAGWGVGTYIGMSSDGEFAIRLKEILTDAKVSDVAALAGKPVEITFDRNILADWRILKEVL